MATEREVQVEDAKQAPRGVIGRLSLYLRAVTAANEAGQTTIRSQQLAQRLGLTDAQVRRDLAWFGPLGRRGVGYDCDELLAAIRRILGRDEQWPVALVGAGNLGRALLGYRGFLTHGFRLAAAFDVDPAKVGDEIAGARVYGLDRLSEIVQELKIRLAIVAVPADEAHPVAQQLAAAGVEGILNFAPAALAPPEGVLLVNVDVATELDQLRYAVRTRPGVEES